MSQGKENQFDQGMEIALGVEYGGTEQLIQEKIEARMRLLALPPAEAQKLVEQTLYPQYWDVSLEALTWEESIPTYSGEEDRDSLP